MKPQSMSAEEAKRGNNRDEDRSAETTWHTNAEPFVPSQQTSAANDRPQLHQHSVLYSNTEEPRDAQFHPQQSPYNNNSPLMSPPQQTNQQQPQNYQQHSQSASFVMNNFENNSGYDVNAWNPAGIAADMSCRVAYGGMFQAPNTAFPAMQQQMFNGYNHIQTVTPGVLIQAQQSMHQGEVVPSRSSQIAMVPGYPSMSGSPIVTGYVAPVQPINLPRGSSQHQQQLQYPYNPTTHQVSINQTLPHHPTEHVRSSHNRSFAGFTETRRRVIISKNQQTKSSRHQKSSQKSFIQNSRENGDSQPPESRKTSEASSISYKNNKALVASGYSIPMNVTRDDNGLANLITGLTKDVVRLQQVVQILVNERDAAVASKAKHHQSSSTQTILPDTKEQQVQVGSEIGYSVEESEKMHGFVESAPLAKPNAPSKSIEESPKISKTIAEAVPVNPSADNIINESLSHLQSSTATFKTDELPESAQETKKKPLVSGKTVDDRVVTGKLSELKASLPIIDSSSLADDVPVDTGYSEQECQKEPSLPETSMPETSDHVNADGSPVLVSTSISTKESQKKILKLVNKDAEARVDDKRKGVGTEKQERTGEIDAKRVEMASKHTESIAKARGIEKPSECRGADDQKTFRRADYSDIVRINLPASPAARSQPISHQTPISSILPPSVRNPIAHVHAEELPDGFKYPKKTVRSPSLTNEELRRSFANRRLIDSPVITLVQKPQEATETTPSKTYHHHNPKKSAMKRTPNPKKTPKPSAEDYDEFVNDERIILDFTATIKSNLSDYAVQMKKFRAYFASSPQERPVVNTLMDTLIDYWSQNRFRSFDSKSSKQVQDHLKSRVVSLNAKKDLSSRKLKVFLQVLLESNHNLLSDDVFYFFLLSNKSEQLSLLSQYMELVALYPEWKHRLDLPPLQPNL